MDSAGVEVADWKLALWKSALKLHRCNVATSRELGAESKGPLAMRSIGAEAEEAMAACVSEAGQLAKAAPASEVEAIKAAIVRANVKVIKETRNPPPVACGIDIDETGALCSRWWRR